jgi:putative hydrolase of the HAD superfamily
MATPQSSVDALLFDFGGVLVSIDFARAFAAWARAANVSPATLAARFTFDLQYEAHEKGELESAQYFESLRYSLGISISDREFLAGWNAIFLEPLPGIAELLRALSTTLPVYLFSNTNRAHHAYWRERYRELLEPLSAVYCSHEIGARKPAPQAFREVAARIGHAAGRIAFFDDLEENVLGARDAGLQSFRVASPAEVRDALVNHLYLRNAP